MIEMYGKINPLPGILPCSCRRQIPQLSLLLTGAMVIQVELAKPWTDGGRFPSSIEAPNWPTRVCTSLQRPLLAVTNPRPHLVSHFPKC